MFFNLSDRTITKGVSVGQERTVVLSVDGELEKVNYLGVDYSLHTLEVKYLWYRLNLNTFLLKVKVRGCI